MRCDQFFVKANGCQIYTELSHFYVWHLHPNHLTILKDLNRFNHDCNDYLEHQEKAYKPWMIEAIKPIEHMMTKLDRAWSGKMV